MLIRRKFRLYGPTLYNLARTLCNGHALCRTYRYNPICFPSTKCVSRLRSTIRRRRAPSLPRTFALLGKPTKNNRNLAKQKVSARLPRLRARSLCTFLSIPFLSLSSYSSLFSTSEKLPRLREPASFTLSRARELNKFETRERRDDLVSFPRILVYFSDVLGFARTVWAYGSKLIYAAWNWHDR